MRKVILYVMDSKPPYTKFKYGEGWFHCWGIDYEEYCEGPSMQYTCAIVEMETGEVEMPSANMIKFIKPRGE